jgi:hypothetical protein
MLRTKCLFTNGERPLIEWLGLRIGIRGPVEMGEISEARGRVWMLGAKRLFTNGERPLTKWLGLRIGTRGPVEASEMGEARGRVWMLVVVTSIT